jgi:hypothetical protein
VEVVREEYPEAKIVMGSRWRRDAEAILAILDEVGPIFDVVAWHPWYQADVASKDFIEYPGWVRNLKKDCEARGFRGEYMATEWTWSASYPIPPEQPIRISEMQKAKYAARLTLTHLALDVYSFWNETFQQNIAGYAIGLLRNSFSASPLNPTQPEPIYYVMRTLSTVMDEANPAEMKVQISAGFDRPIDGWATPSADRVEWYAFRKPDGQLMLALWTRGHSLDDDSQQVIADVMFPGVKLNKACAIDVLNGTEQSLSVAHDGDNTVLRSIHIQDWPIIISGSQA